MPVTALFSRLRRPLHLLMLCTAGWLKGARTSEAATLVPPRECTQAIVVIAEDWRSSTARLQRFARPSSAAAWAPVGEPMPVVIGSSGLGWGLGLHSTPAEDGPRKVEGDRRAPAGMFTLGEAFGSAGASELAGLKWPLRRITPTLEAIDDPKSRYYNRIVDRAEIARPDWHSSEKMAAISVYALGLVVAHNPERIPGHGSCIFLHLTAARDNATAGCTTLRRTDLAALLRWLDPQGHPVLIQLPQALASRLLPPGLAPAPR